MPGLHDGLLEGPRLAERQGEDQVVHRVADPRLLTRYKFCQKKVRCKTKQTRQP